MNRWVYKVLHLAIFGFSYLLLMASLCSECQGHSLTASAVSWVSFAFVMGYLGSAFLGIALARGTLEQYEIGEKYHVLSFDPTVKLRNSIGIESYFPLPPTMERELQAGDEFAIDSDGRIITASR